MSTSLRPGKADFMVAKSDIADMILSVVTYDQINQMKSIQGVNKVVPYVMGIVQTKGNPYFIVGGVDPDDAEFLGLKLSEGRLHRSDDEVVLGRIVAKNRNLKTGDKLMLGDKSYSIVGIFESGVTMQDGGAATTLPEAQRIQSLKSDQVTMAMVKTMSGYTPRQVADKIEQTDSSLIGIVDVEDYNSTDQGLKIIDSVSLAISLLAIVIGGVGVMNTIITSVFERTREIGVLRAVGWKKSRVMAMILGEAIIIAIIATVIGTILGLSVIWLVMQTDMGEAWLSITWEAKIFFQALIVALLVVIIGALYPAYRASKFSPMEALRYE